MSSDPSVERPAGKAASGPAGMRVLIVGNYPGDRQYSMQGFARALVEGLRGHGVTAEAIAPGLWFGQLARLAPPLAKLLGYIDKYLLFPPLLRWRVRGCDLVHIVDQANAPYRSACGRRRLLITCHDLFAVRIMLGEIGGQRFGWNGLVLQRWILASLRRIGAIACVSEATARDVRRLVGSDRTILTIANALDGAHA